MAEPIDAELGGTRNRVLDGGLDAPTGRGSFRAVPGILHSIRFRGIRQKSELCKNG